MANNTETNKKLIMVCYHSPCSDGHAAAWAIKSNIPRHAEYSNTNKYEFKYYWQAPGCPKFNLHMLENKKGNSEVWFLDLAPSKDLFQKVIKLTSRIVILDHHKTNEGLFQELKSEYEGSNDINKLTLLFDMNRAGCQIAWDWIISQIPCVDMQYSKRPWFIDYIADRDLWAWKLPNSQMINDAMLGLCYLKSIDSINELMEYNTEEKIKLFMSDILLPFARVSQKINNDLIQSAIENAVSCKLLIPSTSRSSNLKTYKCWAASISGSLRSELGNMLCDKQFPSGELPELSVIWDYNFKENEWRISLRSNNRSSVDCAEIAKLFGGGGHQRAAGFTLHSPNTLSSILLRE